VRHRVPLLLLLVLAFLGCGDFTEPSTSMLRVVVVTQGIDADADGYHVTIDQRPPVVVAAGDTLLVNVPEGSHSVRLSDLAANCVRGGPGLVDVTVLDGRTTEVLFIVTCGGVTGVLRVEAPTTGDTPDPDGYLVHVTSPAPGNAMTLPSDGFIDIPNLIGGAYQVTISGLAASCAVAGGSTRQVSIVTGHITRDTAYATFHIACLGGSVEIAAPTTGEDQDSTYTVTVDGAELNNLSSIDSLVISLEIGDHSILLGDLAPNCTVQGPNPVTVTIGQGSRAAITFPVACIPNRATARISSPLTGGTLDTDVRAGVDQVCDYWYYYCTYLFEGTIPPDGNVLVEMTPGVHQFYLLDLASNCTVSGTNPRAVHLPVGDTVDVIFHITCAPAGKIRVTTPTTGALADTEYLVTLDNGGGTFMAAGDSLILPLVPAGVHVLTLTDVAAGCQVSGPNPQVITVTVDGTIDVVFPVTCDPDASLVISAPTSGGDPDPSYVAVISQSGGVVVPSNGSVTVPVYGGTYSVLLTGLEFNCAAAGPNPVTVTVPPAGTANATIPVICTRYTGTARFTMTTTGPNQPNSLLLDYSCYYYYGCSQLQVPANGVATVDLGPGIYAFSFANIPANCSVSPATSVQLSITTGVTTDAAFNLICQ